MRHSMVLALQVHFSLLARQPHSSWVAFQQCSTSKQKEASNPQKGRVNNHTSLLLSAYYFEPAGVWWRLLQLRRNLVDLNTPPTRFL